MHSRVVCFCTRLCRGTMDAVDGGTGIAMFEFLLGRGDPTRGWPAASGQPLTFDLDSCRLNTASLGGAVNEASFLGPAEDRQEAKDGYLCYYSQGVCVVIDKDAKITYIWIFYEDEEEIFRPFSGTVTYRGAPVRLSGLSIEGFLRQFGECYWRDSDEDETILFYELGEREWQIEFNERGLLKRVLATCEPIMAEAEQRAAYGVTTPWSPQA